MTDPTDDASAAEVRREAGAWMARMRGADADRSRFAFERWRNASPEHRRVYAEMQQLSRQAEALGGSATADAHYARLARPRLFARPALAVTCACIAALLCVGIGVLVVTRHGRDAPASSPGASIATAIGRIDRVRLADGTNVTLDTDSQIVPMFDSGTRLVRLVRGRARFDVAHDAARPFAVEAGDRLILDRGTVFDVAIGREGVKVALLRGAVEIHERGTGRRAGRAVVRLAPGQVFADRPDGAVQSVSTAPNGSDRWVEGMLSYDGAALGDVVADINRYSTHKLRLADPALAALKVTGAFSAEPLDAAANILAVTLKLHVVPADNGDLILER